jgi:hypothetical protein
MSALLLRFFSEEILTRFCFLRESSKVGFLSMKDVRHCVEAQEVFSMTNEGLMSRSTTFSNRDEYL